MTEESRSEEGGRVFFTRARRAPDRDATIRLVSVGVDIGSSTAHLSFSRIVLQRRGPRARVIARELLHQSDIALTPYADDTTIDTEALGRFIAAQYDQAGIERDMVDTGALILTGMAARRANARAIGDLFAAQGGRFVSVAAGDGLETMLAAHGSGAVAESARGARVMNVDIGGGTSKIAVCEGGAVVDLTAIDIGARLVCLDATGRVSRIEPAGQVCADRAGVALAVGEAPPEGGLARLVADMADTLFAVCSGADDTLLRLPALRAGEAPDELRFSGGVADHMAGRESRDFGDLGQLLAEAVMSRMRVWAKHLVCADAGIRATVIGASQYSVQLSGNTIFVSPASVLPLANVAVIAPDFAWDEVIDPHIASVAVRAALRRMDLADGHAPVAIFYRWQGAATHARIAAFCAGLCQGLAQFLARGLPLVLVGDGDVGGLIGVQCHDTCGVGTDVVSIDGIVVGDLDYIDIGEILLVSGGVPVVVKSLLFPTVPSSPTTT